MLPEMDMHIQERGLEKIWRWIAFRPRQFRRKGQIALTRECLLFAFPANQKEAPAFDINANYHVLGCANNVMLSEKGRACTPIKGKTQYQSYVVAIPYGEVNTLARGKYSTSDLASVSTAYVTAAAGVIAAIASGGLSAAKERALGITVGVAGLYYIFGIARPRTQDNYIAIFIEPQAPQIRLSRESNHVTVSPLSPHYFVGEQIKVSDVENSDLAGVSEICRDPKGIALVTTKVAHGLPLGAQVQIANVADDPSFNGQFLVASVPSATTFTYEQEGKPEAPSLYGEGKVKDIWNGVFLIDSVTQTGFTYEQVGPNDSTVSTGTTEAAAPGYTNLTIKGNLAPTGANSRSVDLTGIVALNQPPPKSDELFKKGDLLIFRIPNFHDYYNISMTLTAGTGLTFVPETAEKTGK